MGRFTGTPLEKKGPRFGGNRKEKKDFNPITAGREVLGGATFNTADEIQGAIAASMVPTETKRQPLSPSSFEVRHGINLNKPTSAVNLDELESRGFPVSRPNTFKENYEEARDELRGESKAFSADNSKSAFLLQLLGGLATGGAGAAKLAPMLKNASKAKKLAALSGTGGAFGAASGFGASEGETAKDIAVDTAIGGGTGAVLSPLISTAGGAIKKPVEKVVKKSFESLKNETLKRARQLGYKVNPSQANPSVLNQTLEGVSGKIKTGQAAAEHNQKVTNGLVKKQLGIDESEAITPERLDLIRRESGRAYEKISNFTDKVKADNQYLDDLQNIIKPFNEAEFDTLKSDVIEKRVIDFARKTFSPKSAVNAIKQLRSSAKKRLKSFDDPEKAALGKAELEIANSLEGILERNLEKAGKSDLLQSFRTARQKIAQTYTAEKALNLGSGNINAHRLAKELEKGVPLSGEMKDVAQFASSFKSATQEIKSSMPFISPLDVSAATISASSSGNPGFLGMLALRPAIRKLILSKPYQSALVNPPEISKAVNTAGLTGSQELAEILAK